MKKIVFTVKEMEKMMRHIDRDTGQSEWDIFEMDHRPSEFTVIDENGMIAY